MNKRRKTKQINQIEELFSFCNNGVLKPTSTLLMLTFFISAFIVFKPVFMASICNKKYFCVSGKERAIVQDKQAKKKLHTHTHTHTQTHETLNHLTLASLFYSSSHFFPFSPLHIFPDEVYPLKRRTCEHITHTKLRTITTTTITTNNNNNNNNQKQQNTLPFLLHSYQT